MSTDHRDVVLVTIDCLRHDALDAMPNLRATIGDGVVRTEAITHSCATPWVSTALMQSRLFPEVLSDVGRDREAHARYSVDDAVPSLPEVLSEEGYSTAAFIASNPNLRQYRDHFDAFWDGIDPSSHEGSFGSLKQWANRVRRTLLLRKEVPADELIDRAEAWYEDTPAPRFLWLHFMEPHYPYYPGIERGRDVGLFDAYRANVRKFRSDDRVADVPDRDFRTLRDLYWECIRSMDDHLPRAFSMLDDDAIVALSGDHGEAFGHGWIGHIDLYDETVRVPLLLYGVPDSGYDGGIVPQLDVPAILLDAVGKTPPESWDGVPLSRNRPLEAVIATVGPRLGRSVFSVGLRTETEKLIRRYDTERGEFVGSEHYDLLVDPGETENRYRPGDPPDVEARLDELIEEKDLVRKLGRFKDGQRAGDRPGVSDQVEGRLQELGYR